MTCGKQQVFSVPHNKITRLSLTVTVTYTVAGASSVVLEQVGHRSRWFDFCASWCWLWLPPPMATNAMMGKICVGRIDEQGPPKRIWHYVMGRKTDQVPSYALFFLKSFFEREFKPQYKTSNFSFTPSISMLKYGNATKVRPNIQSESEKSVGAWFV